MSYSAFTPTKRCYKYSRSDPVTSISIDAIIFQKIWVLKEDSNDVMQKWCKLALALSTCEVSLDNSIDLSQ